MNNNKNDNDSSLNFDFRKLKEVYAESLKKIGLDDMPETAKSAEKTNNIVTPAQAHENHEERVGKMADEIAQSIRNVSVAENVASHTTEKAENVIFSADTDKPTHFTPEPEAASVTRQEISIRMPRHHRRSQRPATEYVSHVSPLADATPIEEKQPVDSIENRRIDTQVEDVAIRIRPRRKREPNTFPNEFQFLNCFACLLVIFGVFVTLLFCTRESGYIESENRNLTEMPSLSWSSYIDGSFSSDYTTYFTDTIPDREKLKKMCANFTKLFGVSGDVKLSGNLTTVTQETLDDSIKKATTTVTAFTGEVTTKSPDETTTTSSRKETTQKVDENMDEGTVYGNVIVSGSGAAVRAVSAFYGTFENTTAYAEAINKYKEDLGDSVNIYNMSIPISSAFYLPYNFKDQVTSQEDNIDNIAANLEGIINVNVYSTLENHADEYIYSRTDHHWQPLGAYYAAAVFAKQAGVDFPELDEYEKKVKTDFCGTMYMYSDYDQELANNPDTFTYYMPKNDYTTYYYDTDFKNKTEGTLFYDYSSGVNTYSTILGGDELIAEIDTDVDNKRVLVIVKDSFGNALVPFFVNSFSKIYVVDFRYINTNLVDFVKNVGGTDLLFSMSITSNATPSHITTIDNDRIQ